MTEFIFIRHGETEMNTKPHLVGGRSNHTPLTERGKEQASRLGQYLFYDSSFRVPDAIYSSPAIRTVTTGLIACAEARFSTTPIIQDNRLLEISQGEFEGTPRDAVYTDEAIRTYQLNQLDGALPGGESILDAQLRMRDFVDEIHEQQPMGSIHIYGHGLAIRALAGHIQGSTKQQILTGQMPNVSLTVIDVVDSLPSVRFVGKTVIAE